MVRRSESPLPAELLLAAATLLLAVVGGSPARANAREGGGLVALAARQFTNLTHAERAMLDYADVANTDRGEFALAGPSAIVLDPSNDPARADKWDHQRDIRAQLIRWLCVDPAAVALVDPGGIRVLGARIVDSLNLSYVHVPFALVLNNCSIPGRINLHSADVAQLNLNGSYTGEIDGEGINVRGELFLGYGFHASGEVILQDARIDGYIDCGAGHFRYSKVEPQVWGAGLHKALNLEAAQIRSDVYLWDGFESDGMIYLADASIGADLFMSGARVVNPGQVALIANNLDVKGNVLMGYRSIGENSAAAASYQRISTGILFAGLVDFTTARVGGNFVVIDAKFRGRPSEPGGLVASGLSVKSAFLWTDVALESGALLNIGKASIGSLIDDERSWPAAGKLTIDGLTYLSLNPTDVRARLRWIGLESSFHPQPYRQLAKVLRDSGDDAGAVTVLIAEQDARYRDSYLPRRLMAGFLKVTIGYGHRPLLALLWSLVVVLIGSGVIVAANRMGLMRETWPENAPAKSSDRYERLSPFLYSLDVFVPFVNLHQEPYWWPDADARGEVSLFNHRFRISGRALRRYLWLQIIAGWVLSAIFVAGVTGLIRND